MFCGIFLGGLPNGYNKGGSGSVTIEDNSLTLAKLVQIPTLTILGNPTGLTNDVQSIGLGNGLTFDGSDISIINAIPTGTTNGAILSYDTTSSEYIERTELTVLNDILSFKQTNQITNALQVRNTSDGWQHILIGNLSSYETQSYARGLVVGYSRNSGGGSSQPQVAIVGDTIGGRLELRTRSLDVSGRIVMDVPTSASASYILISAKNDPYFQIENVSSGGSVKIYAPDVAGVEFRLPNSTGFNDDILGNLGAGVTTWVSPNTSNGYAKLDGSGKLPSSIIPAIALSEFYTVADATERDALTVQSGDWAVTTDNGKLFIYNGTSWIEINPTSEVLSVNSQTGNVVLTTTHINEGTNLYYTEGRFNTSFGGKNTDALSEGATNWYYTEGRFNTSLATKDTDNLSEGATNKYNKNYITEEFEAGENLVFGDVCRLDVGTATMMKADNSSLASSKGLIGICLETTLLGSNIGTFLLSGVYSGLTTFTASTGEQIYIGDSFGTGTVTEPSASGKHIRILGYCVDDTTDTFLINPSDIIIEVA